MDALINQMVTALQDFFAGNAYLTVFFISLLPMVEIGGSMPIAIELGMHPAVAYFFTALSSALVCPIIILCIKFVLDAFKKTKLFKKIALVLEENFKSRAASLAKKAERGAEQKDNQEQLNVSSKPIQTEQNISQKVVASEKKQTFYKSLGLFVFIVLPFPLTGLWTGSAIAAFIDLKFRYSLPSLVLGNLVRGVIILVTTLMLGENSYIIILVWGIFIVLAILITIFALLIKKHKKTKAAKFENSSPSEKPTQLESDADNTKAVSQEENQ